MERPIRFEHHRFLGDKRTQRVYDLDTYTDAEVIDELMAAETYLCFGPDTLPEARNRGYRLAPGHPVAGRRVDAGVEVRFPSSGNLLAAHLARPKMRADVTSVPSVVLAHGYPSDVSAAAVAASALPELADRLAAEMGWLAMALAFRGCGGSEGSFSLGGWLEDLHAAVDHLRANEQVSGVWLVGFGTGGALAICAAADDPQVRGVASLGAPGRLRRLGVAPQAPARARPRGGDDRRGRPSRRTSTTGPASSGTCERCRAPAASRPARCSSCTAATTTSSRCSTPGSSSTPTAPPSSGS